MADYLQNTLENIFKLKEFRDPQKTVCSLVVKRQNVLFVAPTSLGKSLCYQLPGVILGPTLVVSPLIALIEDQYSKINKLGLKAERLHSGMKDIEVRDVINRYTRNEYNFLFIAPERLGTSFIETLQNHPPALIAIDESHSISEAGADYRPDYRLLKGRLPKDVPVIALTATATPEVQKDILNQLNIENAQLIVHGFRRTNISIHIQTSAIKQRETHITNYLSNPTSKPAIVYCGTRKQTETMAATLKRKGHKCEFYHAGMTPKNRSDVQNRFMSGDLDVITCTCAFSMGIDKPNIRSILHMSMPSSIEAYYQEIGRAGRDGLPSNAVMFCNYEDKARQTWFHEKSYPPIDFLNLVYNKLTDQPQTLNDLIVSVPTLNEDTLNNVLGKLITYGAAIKSYNNYIKGNDSYRKLYLEAKKNNLDKLESIFSFTKENGCRMLGFLHYFGDTNDDYLPCNMCDNCKEQQGKTPRALNKTKAETVTTQPTQKFSPGNYVIHTKYGIGRVEKSEVGSLGNRNATIRFTDGTRRVIMEKYLQLKE